MRGGGAHLGVARHVDAVELVHEVLGRPPVAQAEQRREESERLRPTRRHRRAVVGGLPRLGAARTARTTARATARARRAALAPLVGVGRRGRVGGAAAASASAAASAAAAAQQLGPRAERRPLLAIGAARRVGGVRGVEDDLAELGRRVARRLFLLGVLRLVQRASSGVAGKGAGV